MTVAHEPLTLEEIDRASERIAGGAIRTPLVRPDADVQDAEFYLKLEVHQPIGSFKIRGAGSLIGSLSDEELADGVWTASRGTWPRRSRGTRVARASRRRS